MLTLRFKYLNISVWESYGHSDSLPQWAWNVTHVYRLNDRKISASKRYYPNMQSALQAALDSIEGLVHAVDPTSISPA